MHNLWCYVVKLSQRLRSDYDIREIDEDLYLAVLQAVPDPPQLSPPGNRSQPVLREINHEIVASGITLKTQLYLKQMPG